MGRVADQQHAGAAPLWYAARFDREQGHLVPVLQMLHSVFDGWRHSGHGLLERLRAGGLQLLIAALKDHIPNLPVVATAEEHNELAVTEVNFPTTFVGRGR